jgi:hypothetical protein
MDSGKECTRIMRKHKSALTKAQNSGDQSRILAAARNALAEFESTGLWPDCWSLWERAKDDATFALQRMGRDNFTQRMTTSWA